MCMQCVSGAATAVGAASGFRAWFATRDFAWLTPRRLRALTIALIFAAVLVSSVVLGGTGPDGSRSKAAATQVADQP